VLTKRSVGYLLAKIERYESAFREIIALPGLAHDGDEARLIAEAALRINDPTTPAKSSPDTEALKSHQDDVSG